DCPSSAQHLLALLWWLLTAADEAAGPTASPRPPAPTGFLCKGGVSMKRSWVQAFGLAVALGVLASQAYAQNPPEPRPRERAAKDITIRGKVVRVQAPDQIVIRTDGRKEAVLYANPRTRYLSNKQP